MKAASIAPMSRVCVCALLLLGLFSVLSASSAEAQARAPSGEYAPSLDPRPRSGLGGVIAGGAALGIAALNLVTLPMCSASFYPSDAEESCVVLSIAFASIASVVAVPALSVGLVRRKKYKAWRARQRAPVSSSFAPTAVHGGYALVWRGRF